MMGRTPSMPLPGMVRYRLAATALALAALAAPTGAQLPPTRLASIDVYRTTQLDAEDVERRYAPAIRELVAAISANDEEARGRIQDEIVESLRESGDFAFVALDITTTFAVDENVLNATIELVDSADAAARLSFDLEPTGSVPDPDGVLASWAEYERTSIELVQKRQIEPTIADCPAHHCIVGFEHPALAPFLERFDRAAREHHDALVRNNVMRVLLMVAQRDREVAIPFAPLARRIDDPDSGCRNKAASLMAVLADRPEYRDDILAIAPAVLRLLRLEKPNNHDPAYDILRTISGESFGERDYERWQAWIEQTRRAGASASSADR